MDSKQLYVAAGHLTSTINWDKDWIHFGTGTDLKKDLINDFIDKFLIDDTLNLVHGRQDSGMHLKNEIKEKILNLLGQDNFQLWNESLTKVIDFNRIGVLKLGRK
jgi:hypothetical protein